MGLLDLFSEKNRYPAECVVEIDGETIDDLYPSLVEVEVDMDRTKWTVATLILETRRLEDGNWVIQDDERFLPWKEIKIQAVFGDVTQEVMRGYIKEVRAEHPSDRGAAKVTVTCQDVSIAMDREHREEPWGVDDPITDKQIAEAIAGRHGFSLVPESEDGQTVQDLNQNTTDIRFLQKRAQASGYEIIFYEDTMYFGERRVDDAIQPTIKVYAGPDTNCISFNIRDDGHSPDRAAYQVSAETGTDEPAVEVEPNLTVMGNEPATSRDSGLNNFVWRPQRQGQNDGTQMEAVAQQAANDASMRIKVDGELDGTMYGHVLLTGLPVGVDGVGERYGGTYYVDAVRHKFDMNGYRLSFSLSRNAYGDNLPEESNPLAAVL